MNLHTVEQVVALLDEHAVSEIDVEMNGERVRARRSLFPVSAPPVDFVDTSTLAEEQIASLPAAPPVPETFLLTAPMVGIFHHNIPSVNAGTSVQTGKKIGAIEAMKLMNDVKADEGGRVLDVLAEDGGPVEYGQPLLRLQRQAVASSE